MWYVDFKRKMKKADAGRHQPFSYSYEEENKLRCLGSLTIGESVFIHILNILDTPTFFN